MYKNVFNFIALPTPWKCQHEKNKDDKDVEQLELSYTAVDIYIDIITLKNCLAIPTNVEFTHTLSSFYS